MDSRKVRFDVFALPIIVEYAAEPVDLEAVRDALEQLLLATQAGSSSNLELPLSGDVGARGTGGASPRRRKSQVSSQSGANNAGC